MAGLLAEEGADLVGPRGVRVVDGEVGAVLRDERDLPRSARQADDRGARVLRVLHEQRADASGGRRDHDHGVRAEFGELEDPHDRTAGADHGDGLREVEVFGDLVDAVDVGDGEFGVASGGEAEVGDHALAEPQGGHALAEGLDDPGDLAAGDGGQFGRPGQRTLLPLAQGGVQEVDACRSYGDTDLAGARCRVLGGLVGEVLGGAEGVQADGAHG